jgi:hypothetical protein
LQLATILDKVLKENQVDLIFEIYDCFNNLYASDKIKRE